MRISPLPGLPGSTSSTFRTSGPPCSWMRIALLIVLAFQSKPWKRLHDASDKEEVYAGDCNPGFDEWRRLHSLEQRHDAEHAPQQEDRQVYLAQPLHPHRMQEIHRHEG